MTGINNNTKLVLHMDGSDEGTTFTDSSLSGHTVTSTAADTFMWLRPDGSDIGEGWYAHIPYTGTVTVVSNKLRCSVPVYGSDITVAARSYFGISGDFDIQVDFNVISFPEPSSSENSFMFRIDLPTTGGGINRFLVYQNRYTGVHRYFCWVATDGSFSYGDSVSTSDTSGKFRITRSGSTVNCYYWNGSWVQGGNWTFTSCSTDNVDEVRVGSQSAAGNDVVTIDYDNFIINSGTKIDYPSPYTETSEKKFGTASAHFGGDVSYLSIPDSSDWNFGSGDFTIDLWVNFDFLITSGYKFCLVEQYQDEDDLWRIFVNDNGGSPVPNLQFTFVNNGEVSRSPLNYAWDYSAGTWYHIAVTKASNVYRLFVDGDLKDSSTEAMALNDYSGSLIVGRDIWTSDRFHSGYIDELRIIKGEAAWTSNFTPPASPYALQKVSGNLAEDARVIVLNESDWSILSSSEESAGAYEVIIDELDEVSKVSVIARNASGEASGYGNVTPV